jgi:hypothetical protein
MWRNGVNLHLSVLSGEDLSPDLSSYGNDVVPLNIDIHGLLLGFKYYFSIMFSQLQPQVDLLVQINQRLEFHPVFVRVFYQRCANQFINSNAFVHVKGLESFHAIIPGIDK